MEAMLYPLLIVFVLVLLLVGVRRMIRQKALTLITKRSQEITNQAVTAVIGQVKTADFDGAKIATTVDSTLPHRVWGKGITVFEFSFVAQTLAQDATQQIEALQHQLTDLLNDYAQAHNYERFQQSPVFVVSDAWVLQGQLYLDVTNVTNLPTLKYLHDLNQLNDEK